MSSIYLLNQYLVNFPKLSDKEPEKEKEEVKQAEATKTVKEEGEKLEVGHQEGESIKVKEEEILIQPEEGEEFCEPKKLVRVDSNRVELEEKNSEPIIDPLEDSYLNNNPNDSPTIAKTNPDAHQTFQTAAGNSFLDFNVTDEPEPKMEFTKNYSDDLLMGQADAIQGELVSGGADLADFELPPYSGSSSGSEPKQQSPIKQRKSSTSSSSATAQASNNQSVSVAPPDLTAVKDLIISSYSQVSHVFHWKRPIETGVFFAIGLTLIVALTFFSIISVVAYSALGIISASGLIRLYKAVMQALSRSQETPFDHIWDKVLNHNVSMSPAKMHQLIDVSLSSFNSSLVYFKQVLLVEDKFATLKVSKPMQSSFTDSSRLFQLILTRLPTSYVVRFDAVLTHLHRCLVQWYDSNYTKLSRSFFGAHFL